MTRTIALGYVVPPAPARCMSFLPGFCVSRRGLQRVLDKASPILSFMLNLRINPAKHLGTGSTSLLAHATCMFALDVGVPESMTRLRACIALQSSKTIPQQADAGDDPTGASQGLSRSPICITCSPVPVESQQGPVSELLGFSCQTHAAGGVWHQELCQVKPGPPDCFHAAGCLTLGLPPNLCLAQPEIAKPPPADTA